MTLDGSRSDVVLPRHGCILDPSQALDAIWSHEISTATQEQSSSVQRHDTCHMPHATRESNKVTNFEQYDIQNMCLIACLKSQRKLFSSIIFSFLLSLLYLFSSRSTCLLIQDLSAVLAKFEVTLNLIQQIATSTSRYPFRKTRLGLSPSMVLNGQEYKFPEDQYQAQNHQYG